MDFLDLVAVPGTAVPEPRAPRLALAPPGPNPAVHSVTIAFSLAAASDARLAVYDPGGRLATTLASGPRSAGGHRLQWDLRDGRGRRVPPGVYFLRLSVPGAGAERPLVVTP